MTWPFGGLVFTVLRLSAIAIIFIIHLLYYDIIASNSLKKIEYKCVNNHFLLRVSSIARDQSGSFIQFLKSKLIQNFIGRYAYIITEFSQNSF